jgi:hypothetical protein
MRIHLIGETLRSPPVFQNSGKLETTEIGSTSVNSTYR